MRLLVTADIHFNHRRSRPLAIELIDRMNAAGGDGLLIIGDTAVADGDELEQCLSRFTQKGPKLFLCGNHELWTRGVDSYHLFTHELPRRVRALGWRWLETEPFVTPAMAIVGTVGWYDYSFASERLGIPRRFYEAKMSPAAAEYLGRRDLAPVAEDVPAEARSFVARWNDGKFVKLHRGDETFLDECLRRIGSHLEAVRDVPRVLVATHHVPLRQLLPPSNYTQLEFAKAYLGSDKLGDLIAGYSNASQVFCGHSHFAVEAQIGHVHAINLGSSYRSKTFRVVDLPED